MNIEAIFHQPNGAYAYTNGLDTMRVRLRTSARDNIECYVKWFDRCGTPECGEHITPMTWLASDGVFTYWEAELYEPHRRLRYYFQIREGAEEIWYTEDGYSHKAVAGNWLSGFFNWPYLYESQQVHIPVWVRNAVFYEIFSERFASGAIGEEHPQVKEWAGKPEWYNFWGGNLKGIEQHLSYLQALGINALWLTPIFESRSNHKYDIIDYTKIDPYFGTEETFQQLLDACHAHGIRVVLDAVYNHCSSDFFAWRDVVEHGAESPYVDWFFVQVFPPDWRKQNYRMFDHHGHMPKLNTYNPAVQRYLIDAAAKWTRMGVDGWRLDVAGEVDMSLWRAFRSELRAINPDLYIVGEIEHEAARWTIGDQFDGVQHYPLYRAVLKFIAAGSNAPSFGIGAEGKWNATTFDQRLGHIRSWYPTPVLSALLTHLSNHDIPRFLTMCGGDKRKLRLATTFLLTYTGTPMLYYGEEVGMEGGPDPDCRRPMVWEPAEQDADLLTFYRHLIFLRQTHAALRADGVWTCLAEDESGVYAFLRGELPLHGATPNRDVALVVLNNSEEPRPIQVPLNVVGRGTQPCWTDGTAVRDELSGQIYPVENGMVAIELGAYEGAVIIGV